MGYAGDRSETYAPIVKAVAEIHRDAVKGYASNPFVVLNDSPIRRIEDLKGKSVAVNALNGSVDIILHIALQQHGLDPKQDVRVVEMPFGNIGAALRQKRIDCGVVPPYPVLFHSARSKFLQTQPQAVRAWLADYVDAQHWIYDPANRAKVVELTAGLAKTPAASLNEYFLTTKDFYRAPNANISAANIQAPVDAMSHLGLLPKPVSVGAYVDPSFLPKHA